MAEYVYLGDRFTRPELKGAVCDAVRRNGKCVRSRMGTMLVKFAHGRENVLARRLRRLDRA